MNGREVSYLIDWYRLRVVRVCPVCSNEKYHKSLLMFSKLCKSVSITFLSRLEGY